jgi:hypothetical protein
MHKLLALIEGRPVEERTRLPVELAVRGSTAPPAGTDLPGGRVTGRRRR